MKPWSFYYALLAAVAAILVASAAGDPPEGYWAPTGYVERADAMIRSGEISLYCANLDPVAQDSIRTNFEPDSPAADFFAASYLRGDVRTFNEDPRASVLPFKVDGCQLEGVNEFYHRIDLPSAPQVLWRGDVRYRTRGRVTTLFGPEQQAIEVRHPSSPFEPFADPTVPPTFVRDTAGNVVLFSNPVGSGGSLADVTYIGAAPVLTDRRRADADPGLRVNGFQTFPGRPVRLDEGDWVRFELPGAPRTFLVDRETRRGTASLVRLQGRNVERLYLEERDRPFVEPLAQAMDEAVRAAWDQGQYRDLLGNVDIGLSLDLALTEALDARIRHACRNQADAVPDRPRAIALTVMDAFTGEVRAMPSCPDVDYLEEEYSSLSALARGRFLRNQNLRPHPIGSAGKPFWAAAVATRFPNFLDFRLAPDASAQVTDVLGCPLPTPFENSFATAAPVGLESFLQWSCNRYQVLMASTALTVDGERDSAGDCASAHADPAAMRRCVAAPEPGQPSGRVAFCDAVMQVALATDVRGVGASCDELQLLERNFLPIEAFRSVTNAAVVRERAPVGLPDDPLVDQYRTTRYRIDAWRDAIGFFAQERVDTARYRMQFPFSGASPQATNLQLNTVTNLRSHWVGLLLGGENSQWSNFQLAEAMARVMTGRDVTGRFVSTLLDGDEPIRTAETADLLTEDELHGGVRRRVLHAMELVVQGGTARALAGEARGLQAALDGALPDHPYDVYVFAKTGTPAVEKRQTLQSVRVLQRLVRDGEIRWDRAAGRFQVASGAGTYWASLPATFRRYIRDDVLDVVETDPARYTARSGAPTPEHPVYLDAGGLMRVSDLTRPSRRRGAALVLGVLAVPREQGRGASQAFEDWISACVDLIEGGASAILQIPPADFLDPERAVALSTVLYIDDLPDIEGVTSGRAVSLLRELMPALEDFLVSEVAAKVRP